MKQKFIKSVIVEYFARRNIYTLPYNTLPVLLFSNISKQSREQIGVCEGFL